MGRKYAGDRVAIVVRRGEATVRADVTLTDALHPYEPGFLGILPARVASSGPRGVVVRFVFPQSPAAKAGIVAGDRIEKWNGKEVAGAEPLSSAVRHLRPGTSASAVIVHGGDRRTIDVKVAADTETVPADLPAFRVVTKSAGNKETPKGGHGKKAEDGTFP